MIRKIVVVFVILSTVFVSQFFIYSSYINTSDNIHQQAFNNKYNVYSVLKPNNLKFANEAIPNGSNDIWERLDKELLKNIFKNKPHHMIKHGTELTKSTKHR